MHTWCRTRYCGRWLRYKAFRPITQGTLGHPPRVLYNPHQGLIHVALAARQAVIHPCSRNGRHSTRAHPHAFTVGCARDISSRREGLLCVAGGKRSFVSKSCRRREIMAVAPTVNIYLKNTASLPHVCPLHHDARTIPTPRPALYACVKCLSTRCAAVGCHRCHLLRLGGARSTRK